MARNLSGAKIIAVFVIAVVMLLAADFSLWLNNNLFNRQAFSRTTVEVVRTQDVRNAIGAETVDQIFKNSPVLKQVAGDTVKSAISGLLGSQAARPVLEQVAQQANIMITAPTPQEVAIDISGIKGFIKPIASVLNKELGKTISETRLPKTLVLIKKGEVPSIYGWAVPLLWIGPVLGLIGLGFIIALIWLAGADRRPDTLRTGGATLSIGALVFIILVKTLKAPILASIVSVNVRVIAENIFDAFAGKLTAQTWWLFAIGLLMVGAGYLWPRARKLPVVQKIRDFKVAS